MTLSSSPSMRYALRLCVKRTPPVSRSSASCLIWRSISAASSSSLRSAALQQPPPLCALAPSSTPPPSHASSSHRPASSAAPSPDDWCARRCRTFSNCPTGQLFDCGGWEVGGGA
eukprot:CAMPEP_0173234384 /NCGR_PEP_ID=MMETSP1142-20121109/10189_1 /TAXON_ID=483371 /ORGANISM="non described non described, Strain CCMP2298" /LENGTH=114 /DNA_ID=CAMNT_0014164405 /DNA_START=131 /DNA_END=476 /DNA_ORIENTATION=-